MSKQKRESDSCLVRFNIQEEYTIAAMNITMPDEPIVIPLYA